MVVDEVVKAVNNLIRREGVIMKKQKNVSLLDVIKTAMAHHNAGDLQTAERMYRQILLKVPNEADVLHCLGLILYTTKQYVAAEGLIEKAIRVNPEIAQYYNSLALVQMDRGMVKMAIATFRKALGLKSDYAEAYNNLGIALQKIDKMPEAIDCYRTAIGLNPNYAVAFNNLATLLRIDGEFEESHRMFVKAVEMKPGYADPLINIGLSLLEKGEIDEAMQYFVKAYQADPRSAKACCYIGVAYFRKLDKKNAYEWYERAGQLAPYDADIFATLGNMVRDYGSVSSPMAERYYRHALEIRPDQFESLVGIADCFKEARRDAECEEMFNRAIKVNKAGSVKASHAMIIPSMLKSAEEIDQIRDRFVERVTALMTEGVTMGNPHTERQTPNFYLAYHGRNDLELQRLVGRFYRSASPMLTHVSPGSTRVAEEGKRLKIGFISRYLHLRHTIGKLNLGLITKLSSERFDVTLLSAATEDDNTRSIVEDSGVTFHKVPRNVILARKQIEELELDILFFTDIGMDPFTYFLAYSRLAPLQCVTWGHPVTTGIDTIDAFISSDLIEPEDAQEHYTERLVRMKQLPCYYFRPELAPSTKTRADFGLPTEGRIYLCPQSLFKIHPDFDAILQDILRQDPDGVVVLLEGGVSYWTDVLSERFKQTIPDVAKRILFQPRLPSWDFLYLIGLSDVVLDPIHFGSGNSAYEAFHMGKVVVTMPSGFMRGRVTLGCYRMMGIDDAIADSAEGYARMAVSLANNKVMRDELEARIRERSPILFESMDAVHEMETVLETLYAERKVCQ